MKRLPILATMLVTLLLLSCGKRSEGPAPSSQPTSPVEKAATGKEGTVCFRRTTDTNDRSPAKATQCLSAIEGVIKGLIVQKSEVKESPSKEDPSRKVYVGTYHLTNGNEITAIDSEGLHKESGQAVFITVSQKDTPFDDTDVLQAGMGQPDTPGFPGSPVHLAFTSAGGEVVRIGGRTKSKLSRSADLLLGEYRVDPETRKGRLIATVEVSHNNETTIIPVSDFVRFKPALGEAKKRERK